MMLSQESEIFILQYNNSLKKLSWLIVIYSHRYAIKTFFLKLQNLFFPIIYLDTWIKNIF